jgi:hypothetical protein
VLLIFYTKLFNNKALLIIIYIIVYIICMVYKFVLTLPRIQVTYENFKVKNIQTKLKSLIPQYIVGALLMINIQRD